MPQNPAPKPSAPPAPERPTDPTDPRDPEDPPKPPPVPAPDAPVITTPDGFSTAARSLDLAGTATAAATVSVSVDSRALGSAVAGADGAWSGAIPIDTLSDGAWTLQVVQTVSGRSSAAAPVRIVVDRTALPPTIDSVDTGEGDSAGLLVPILTGEAEPGASVEVYDNGTLQTTVTADADGHWTTDQLTEVSDMYSLAARQTDPLGNVSVVSAPATGTIEFPTVTVTTEGKTVRMSATDARPGMTLAVVTDGEIRTILALVGADGTASGVYNWNTTGEHWLGYVYVVGNRRGLVSDIAITMD